MPLAFKVNLKFPTDLNKVTFFIEQISSKIFNLTKSREDAFKVKLALEEALTNAIIHGNNLDPKLKVKIAIQATKKKVVLNIHDQGKGFDLLRIPDPTRKDRVGRPSGRGVFLMRSLMNEVKFYDRGRGVRMIRYFSLSR